MEVLIIVIILLFLYVKYIDITYFHPGIEYTKYDGLENLKMKEKLLRKRIEKVKQNEKMYNNVYKIENILSVLVLLHLINTTEQKLKIIGTIMKLFIVE